MTDLRPDDLDGIATLGCVSVLTFLGLCWAVSALLRRRRHNRLRRFGQSRPAVRVRHPYKERFL